MSSIEIISMLFFLGFHIQKARCLEIKQSPLGCPHGLKSPQGLGNKELGGSDLYKGSVGRFDICQFYCFNVDIRR